MVQNIVGVEAAQDLIQEYLQRRGYIDPSKGTGSSQVSSLQPYVKPSADATTAQTKKQTRTQKDPASSSSQSSKSQSDTAEPQVASKRGPKKKGGKVISLAEAAKGSIVFKQGKPCSCQARQHNLVSNCLSCGKIVCEQEGEGPCSFCGALVLMEGSTYAGLTDAGVPSSETEAAAEAYAKRLVDYDRNSAARTKVYDDQSDYFEMEGNSWLSSKVIYISLVYDKTVPQGVFRCSITSLAAHTNSTHSDTCPFIAVQYLLMFIHIDIC
jgi:hypothetical protein